jgi:hypothetical protein
LQKLITREAAEPAALEMAEQYQWDGFVAAERRREAEAQAEAEAGGEVLPELEENAVVEAPK